MLESQTAELVYSLSDLTRENYDRVKEDREMEHQIGRLTNFKRIILDEIDGKIEGDLIEFGSWHGFSLAWLAHLASGHGRKIIGIDSFKGLPEGEGFLEKGWFGDASLESCRERARLFSEKENVFVEKFLFYEKDAILKRLKEITDKKFCLVHIDCDLSSSAREIFKVLTDGDLIAPTAYILFDDYGLLESYARTVDELMSELSRTYKVEEHSSTKLTKNFLVKKWQNNSK